MVSKEPFINQDISYINEKCEMNCFTIYDYITYFNIIEIAKIYEVLKKEKTSIESVSNKLMITLYGLNNSN